MKQTSTTTQNPLTAKQAQELIELRQRFDALDRFFASSSFHNGAFLTGALEKIHCSLERLEQQHGISKQTVTE